MVPPPLFYWRLNDNYKTITYRTSYGIKKRNDSVCHLVRFMNVLGIDVGMTGAIASLSHDLKDNIIHDMPVYSITKGKTARKTINIPALLEIFKNEKAEHVYIERGAAFGMGVTSAFSFGFGVGVVEACVVAAGLPFTYVSPQTWKKAMNCPADKDGARMRASQLMPDMAHWWERRKDHGRAESALIALWGLKE